MTDMDHVSGAEEHPSKPQVSRTTFLKAAGAAAVSAAGAGLFGGVAPALARSTRAGFTQIPFYTTEDDPNTQAVHTAAAEDFSSAHPGVTIAINYISNADRDQRILTGLSVGQDLGIFEIGGTYRADLEDAQKWATQQLQKTVAAWKAEHPGWRPPV